MGNFADELRLYVIVDRDVTGDRDYVEIAREVIRGGADVIQLRDKELRAREFIGIGRRLREVTRKHQVSFIVNDRADLAVALEADGVHLGQDDLPIEVARSILGPEKIIGKTAHSISEAQEAEREGADYVSLGPIFLTSVKPELRPVGLGIIRKAKELLKVPFVAIGGINKDNLRQVLDAGAQRVAVVRASLAAKDIARATRELKNLITNYQLSNTN